MKLRGTDETGVVINRRKLLTGTACCALGLAGAGIALHLPGPKQHVGTNGEEFVIVNGWVLLPEDLPA